MNKIIKSWRVITQILVETGYYDLYKEEVKTVADYLRETGVEKILGGSNE